MLSTFNTVLSLVLILNIKGIFATETTQCNELKEIVEEVKQTCDRRYKELEERFNAHGEKSNYMYLPTGQFNFL